MPLAAPPLAGIGQRAAPGWLRLWLTDPQAPGAASRMPDLLHGLDTGLRTAAVEDLTHFLAAQEGPFHILASRPDDWRVAEGGVLFQRLGCFACHDEAGLAARRLAAKTDHARLAAFLREPFALRPGGAMPDCALSEAEASALAAWLLREQHAAGPVAEDLVPGVRYQYVELPEDLPSPGKLDDIHDWTPTRAGLAQEIALRDDRREEFFAYRFEGWLELEREETLRFGLNSDDGSDLWVEGIRVVDNDGGHAPQIRTGEAALAAGRHRVVVRMYEATGGETLEAWIERAGGVREPLGARNLAVIGSVYAPTGHAAFAPDPARVARGARRFAESGCVRCHADSRGSLAADSAPAAPVFAALRPAAGCLADVPPPGAARYALSEAQRAALRATVAHATELGVPLPPAAQAAHALLRLDCVACHTRAGVGGPGDALRARFTGEGDVGDEGRIPPDLTGVGGKLRSAWLAQVLAGDGAVRAHYLHARMPRFPEEQVVGLAAAFDAADERAGEGDAAEFAPDLVEPGRLLGGTGGLNCIQCHPVAGHAAQGMQVMDLTTLHERLEPEWLRAWLRNPSVMRAGTRMPVYFSGGRSVAAAALGGDAEQQIRALESWLALGDSLPLPPGLVVERTAYDLVPVDRPIYVGSFMDGGSARVINVGFPERVHASFDLHHARLMQVWRGDFFNAEGTWHGRAGQLEVPAGFAVRALPAGPAFAHLAAADAPWPVASGREAGWRMLGHRRDALGRPTFRYRHGDFTVEEALTPRYGQGGATLTRRFRLRVPDSGWFLRLGTSTEWTHRDAAWRSADGLALALSPEVPVPLLRDLFDGVQELLIPLPAGAHEFATEMQWD